MRCTGCFLGDVTADAGPAHLFRSAEDVGVVLLEATHTSEAGESSRDLVPMEDSKVGHTERELPPRPGERRERYSSSHLSFIVLTHSLFLSFFISPSLTSPSLFLPSLQPPSLPSTSPSLPLPPSLSPFSLLLPPPSSSHYSRSVNFDL